MSMTMPVLDVRAGQQMILDNRRITIKEVADDIVEIALV